MVSGGTRVKVLTGAAITTSRLQAVRLRLPGLRSSGTRAAPGKQPVTEAAAEKSNRAQAMRSESQQLGVGAEESLRLA